MFKKVLALSLFPPILFIVFNYWSFYKNPSQCIPEGYIKGDNLLNCGNFIQFIENSYYFWHILLWLFLLSIATIYGGNLIKRNKKIGWFFFIPPVLIWITIILFIIEINVFL